MKHFPVIVAVLMLLAGCGQSYEETKRITRQQQREALRRDSAAFKVALMPTLDGLPLWVAQQYHLFDNVGAEVRLKRYSSQMDCDTALLRGRVEGTVTDLVRAAQMEKQMSIQLAAATGAYWQLFVNHNARIRQLKQLDDKMVAMTRFSVTDQLCDVVTDTAGIDKERLYRVQINDVGIRLSMVLNNEIDALFLTEPQATIARQHGHTLLLDSRRMDYRPGALVFNGEEMKRPKRKQQRERFLKAYNQACDSIDKYGLRHFSRLIAQQCEIPVEVADSLPDNIVFPHAGRPRQQDIDKARKWLDGK